MPTPPTNDIAAIEFAKELDLIDDQGAALASRMLSIGINLHEDITSWLGAISNRITQLSAELKSTPYQRYLDGGPKPRRSNGKPDWDAKDNHRSIEKKLADLKILYQQVDECTHTKPDKNYSYRINGALKLVGVIHSILQLHTPSKLATSICDLRDLRLCLAWSNKPIPIQPDLDADYLQRVLGDFDAGRLISARLAEIGAMNYYRALGHKISDISVMQLENTDTRWQSFDLLVDDRAIDVKNARRSFSSPNTYVQHCVPKFKTTRKDNSAIAIVGVLSDYIPSGQLVEFPSNCQILGEVSFPSIEKLRRWALTRFGNFLRLEGMWKPEYQPGWVFEYPQEHYRYRAQAIQEIPDVLRNLIDRGISKAQIPKWMLPLCPDRELALSLADGKFTLEALNDLYLLDDTVGFSRPSLFVHIVGLFAETLVNQEPAATIERTVRELLLVGSSHGYRPLGLEDPQDHIGNLLNCLRKICAEVQTQCLDFKALHMTHPSILRGELTDGRWITLMAYCGGWINHPFKVRCGANPLCFGEHGICPECGHLVCDRCGFCSPTCHNGLLRQQHAAEWGFSVN